MALRDVALGAVCGLVAGWALGHLGGHALAPDPAGPVATPAAPGSRPYVAVAGADTARLVAGQDAQMRELSDVAYGRPQLWPDGVAEALEDEIHATLARCEGRVRKLEVDCSEPPCLVSLDLGTDAGASVLKRCPELQDRFGFRGFSGHDKMCADGVRHSFTVLRVGRARWYRAANPGSDGEFEENEATRARVRTEDMRETFACPE